MEDNVKPKSSKLTLNKNTKDEDPPINTVEDEKIKEKEKAKEKFENELKIAFDLFDEDGSGTISKEEFSNVMRKLGFNPTKLEIEEMLEVIENENKTNIDFDSFKKIMTKSINDHYLIESAIEAFSLFDIKKIGRLEKKEILQILIDYCYMEQDDAEDLITEEYFDENGLIDYVKFVKDTFDMLNY